MLFSLWIIIGTAVILPWFPRSFVKFVVREFPGQAWERLDTGMGVFLTVVAIAAWPLMLALVAFWWLAMTIHKPFVRYFESEKEKGQK